MPSKHVRGICQRCGFEYPLHTLRKEWTGLMVCKDDFDPRHPQDFVKGVKDKQTVDNPAPEPTDYFLSTNEVTSESL